VEKRCRKWKRVAKRVVFGGRGLEIKKMHPTFGPSVSGNGFPKRATMGHLIRSPPIRKRLYNL